MLLLNIYGVLLVIFAGLTTDAQVGVKESYILVAAHLGGDVTFNINGAVHSRCQTHVGQMVVCLHGTTMEGIGPEFQNRISGSCDHIKLKNLQKGDLDHIYICENLDPLKPATYTYSIEESTILLAAHLGGDVTFDINGAVASQCKTNEGRMMVECFGGTTIERIGQEFQDRISGSCDHIKLKDIQKGDLDHRFICENLDLVKYASYTYSIKATTAPPQNVSSSIKGPKVSVSWQPPPAHLQTGPILKYEVKWSCNAPELLMNKTTVAGNSTVLEGLPQGVRCTVSVAAVTSDGVEAWSEPIHPSGSSEKNTQSVEEGKSSLPLLVSLVSVGSLVSLAFLAFLAWCLMKIHRNSVSGPKPNAEQTKNGYPLLDITQPQPHVNDVEEALA